MDFRIETFLCVCRTMNYTKAADELCITQPAVSQHIGHLERQYGVQLFTKTGRRIRLTPAGALLRDTMTVMKNDEHKIALRLKSLKNPVHTLSIGVTMTIGEYVLPHPAAVYMKAHRETNMHIHYGNTARLMREIDAGEIDCALVEGYYPYKNYEHMTFRSEKFIPVCSSSHVFSRPPEKLSDLLPERLILREKGSGTRNILERNLAVKNLAVTDFPHCVTVENMHSIIELLKEDCGISFLYEIAARRELEKGTLRAIELQDFSMTHDFDFVWAKGSIFSQEYRRICSELTADSRPDFI